MSSFRWLSFAFAAVLFFSASERVTAQALGVNPSAAASDVRNPSSTNPSAAASDVRNPSATNPSAAASQIPQSTVTFPRAVAPSITRQQIAPAPRRARPVQRARHDRATRRANAATEMVRPFEALEGARLDRIEFEKRTAGEKAQQRQMENEQKAKQAAENRGEQAKHVPRAAGARPSAPSGTPPTNPDSASH
jgi:hypothetical protein